MRRRILCQYMKKGTLTYWQREEFRMVATSSLTNKNSACISKMIQQRFQQAAVTDFDYWDYVVPEPNFNEMVFEERTCQSLARMLETCLSKSKQTRLHCSRVLVPEKLTRRIAQDILRLSSTEPCGLRGCVIHVNLETGNVCKRLDKIVYDPTVVSTFELTLVFKQDSCSWPSFRDFFSRACFASGGKHTLILSPGFRLIKKKIYSFGTVVEEC
ncbi:DNA damage-inducible transcript 4-like protein [Varanus komodoensis]|nr:DNA damage-inducible transcript 4-like protein [Varanus komodoensis]